MKSSDTAASHSSANSRAEENTAASHSANCRAEENNRKKPRGGELPKEDSFQLPRD